MAQVFLSYDREDAGRARSIAQALEKAGHLVWWDRHIKGGAQYSKEIEQALAAAGAVVVLWSEKSIDSAWVRDEAAAGRDSGRLVPVRIDETEPPLGFRQYQAIHLPRRRLAPAAREALLGAVQAVVGSDPGKSVPNKASRRTILTGPTRGIAASLAFAAFVAAMLLWRPWASGTGELVLAVGPAGSDPASQTMARDLTMKLASMQNASLGSIRLVEATDRAQKPDLKFETATNASAPANASLVLKSAKDSSILWSRDFEQSSGRRADLLQQLAYTAAKVTGCTLEGLQAGERLRPQALKTYLNACAQLADIAGTDPRPVIPMFVTVLREAPRFKPAWRKLLVAEGEASNRLFNRGEPVDPRALNTLRQHIGQARQIDPNMAEAFLAEAGLVPPREISRIMSLVERAAQQSPDDPVVLGYWSGALMRVGRTREAVALAERVTKLDPLSPTGLQFYISALAYAGRFEAAERELRRAERLWSGTAALRDAQYRFHLRYGDPKLAMAMEESDTPGGAPRLYLKTRLEPTDANVRRLFEYMKQRLARVANPTEAIGFAAQTYAEFGGDEELFRLLLNWRKPDDLGTLTEVYFRPQLRQFRRDPRFMQIAKTAGLLDYWQSSGKWPDFCFDNDQPYDCEAEAAKLARAS